MPAGQAGKGRCGAAAPSGRHLHFLNTPCQRSGGITDRQLSRIRHRIPWLSHRRLCAVTAGRQASPLGHAVRPYLNNAVIAAQQLGTRFGKAAIADVDVHHCDGAQFIGLPTLNVSGFRPRSIYAMPEDGVMPEDGAMPEPHVPRQARQAAPDNLAFCLQITARN